MSYVIIDLNVHERSAFLCIISVKNRAMTYAIITIIKVITIIRLITITCTIILIITVIDFLNEIYIIK